MFTRISRSGGRSYLQIVESFRTPKGVRQRVLANLGRLARLADDQLDPLINGLQRALGRVPVAAPVPQYDSALAFGDVYALHARSEEHTSELQSLMRISYAVFCLKNKKKQ